MAKVEENKLKVDNILEENQTSLELGVKKSSDVSMNSDNIRLVQSFENITYS